MIRFEDTYVDVVTTSTDGLRYILDELHSTYDNYRDEIFADNELVRRSMREDIEEVEHELALREQEGAA